MANAIAAEGGLADVASLDCSVFAEVKGELGGVGISFEPAVVGGAAGVGLGTAGVVEGGLASGDARAACFSCSFGGEFAGADRV
jgi:hypothetical protein